MELAERIDVFRVRPVTNSGFPMTNSPALRLHTNSWGAVLSLSALALLDAIFNYFWTGNGIHGTEGPRLSSPRHS